MRFKRLSLLAVLLLAAWLGVSELLGCGPIFEETTFVEKRGPDFSSTEFLSGRLGVLRPTFDRIYLYIAFRHLSGIGLNDREQHALEAVLNPSVRHGWPSFASNADEQADIEAWQETREKVADVGGAEEILVYRQGMWGQGNYVGYLNCPGDAFRNAAATLEKRISQFGPESPYLKDWVEAEDKVLTNCDAAGSFPPLKQWRPPGSKAPESAEPRIPGPATAGTPPILQADRAYQIAAANLYAGRFDAALDGFKKISDDASSPWRTLAPYLAARTLVRKGTLLASGAPFDESILKQAENQLTEILGSSALMTIHPPAQRLLNLVRLRLYPDQRLHELGSSLLKSGSGGELAQSAIDYTRLLDNTPISPPDAGSQQVKDSESHPDAVRQDELTNWIMTFQSQGQAALSYAEYEWKQKQSLPWLVAVLTKITSDDPALSRALAAAAEISPQSPAYLTASFHVVRLMKESGKAEAACRKLDKLLADQNWKGQPSALNLFLGERMALAQDLDEFLHFAPRVVAGYTIGNPDESYELNPESDPRLKALAKEPVLWDHDATKVLNQGLPLAVLRAAAQSKLLSPYLHRQLLLSVWVRSFLLGDEATALDLAPAVEGAAPELKNDLETYRAATSVEARRFAGVNMVLTFPGLRPYVVSGVGRREAIAEFNVLRDNWWGPLKPDPDVDFPDFPWVNWEPPPATSPPKKNQKPIFGPFLSSQQRDQTSRELKRLESVGPAPNYLASQVIAWAKTHKEDSRVPRALHIVVVLPHAGWSDKQTGNFSRAAFTLLHRNYPNDPWTKKTKYWYR